MTESPVTLLTVSAVAAALAFLVVVAWLWMLSRAIVLLREHVEHVSDFAVKTGDFVEAEIDDFERRLKRDHLTAGRS